MNREVAARYDLTALKSRLVMTDCGMVRSCGYLDGAWINSIEGTSDVDVVHVAMKESNLELVRRMVGILG